MYIKSVQRHGNAHNSDKSVERHDNTNSSDANHTTPAVPPLHFHIAEIKQLIALMNSTDVSEIAIAQPEGGVRLVLRRATFTAPANQIVQQNTSTVALPVLLSQPISEMVDNSTRETIKAALVGRFHVAMRQGQQPLVQVGDIVHEGQVVAGIETLHVMNEVESTVAGKVVAILVADGSRVQYGQDLIIVEREA